MRKREEVLGKVFGSCETFVLGVYSCSSLVGPFFVFFCLNFFVLLPVAQFVCC